MGTNVGSKIALIDDREQRHFPPAVLQLLGHFKRDGAAQRESAEVIGAVWLCAKQLINIVSRHCFDPREGGLVAIRALHAKGVKGLCGPHEMGQFAQEEHLAAQAMNTKERWLAAVGL